MYLGDNVKVIRRIPEALTDNLKARLAAELKEQPLLWDIHDASKPNSEGQNPLFKLFRTTQHIVLSFPKSLDSHREARVFDVWDRWSDVVRPIIDTAVSHYGYANGRSTRIMLARLLPGGKIARHVDSDEASRVPHKIHVPLITRPEVEFWIGKGTYYLEPGFAYEVNNRVEHGGCNPTDTERVHLIFDYYDADASD